ncbi:conserved hypothetical protein [Histoplasma mississippiense (nom. inval.)]|uniref:conserved hypothetical protein n=1 Tax=Ajellomyces capsulatus (strain NAm1 / WU24) TaxID=2059318 RepID=UPI000157C894|nr:conserved hypothetical protein [Histoplasma mississippiense (nom. inval.)]EDN09620.1 conserved hypothetical protein [Histoplasma mississippiense (nom. inval.)]
MAPRQTKSDARKAGCQTKANVRKISQGKQPQGVKKPRSREAEDSLHIPAKRPQNRLRISLVSSAAENSVGDTPGQEAASSLHGNEINPIHWWTQKGIWPKEYFEEGSNMYHLLARKKSTSSLRRKQSESSSVASSTTPSDQKPREEKSAPYRNPRYEIILETKGSFMGKSELGIIDESRDLCQRLLETEQTIPKDSLFRDDVFDNLCEMIRNRNEPKVIQDISRLIVPSAQTLAIYGAKHLEVLIESINEGWDNSISVTKPRPQPDYSVGFGRSAFTDVQLDKLKPFVGEIADSCTSYFMATFYMYFPFLTCEVKCGAAALDIADRQNAHSATIAVRAIVELFRLVKREKEVDREIVAFSISHDHTAVRIYGHYAVLGADRTAFYRHPIRKFDFTEQDGKEKWAAYKFTRSVYDIWMPTHLKRICSAIDQIPPNVEFDISQSELDFSQQSNTESVPLEADDSQSSQLRYNDSAGVTPTSSFTEQTQVFKKPSKKRLAE